MQLTAWLDPPGDTFTWKVDAGSIRGTGSQVTWDLNQAATGEHQATLDVVRTGQTLTVASSRSACLARGFVRPVLQAGSSCLRGGEEDRGYGLYSYVLFGEKPRDEASLARYRAVIEQYLLSMPPVLDLQGTRDPGTADQSDLPAGHQAAREGRRNSRSAFESVRLCPRPENISNPPWAIPR